jgi:hypothetical protein
MPAPIGAIAERWRALGGEHSFLGAPTSDEMDFSEGGRVNTFQGGVIYWWPDLGAHEVGEMFVHFQGLNCFATSGGIGSDEPYVVMGISVPGQEARSLRSQIFQDVDGGDTRPDQVLLYRGQPKGIQIVSQLLEHDAGEPAHYEEIMKAVASAAGSGVQSLIKLIPQVGPVLGTAAGPILAALNPAIAQVLENLVGLGDDLLGPPVKTVLTPRAMIQMAERPNVSERQVQFKIASELIVSGDGANYKIYFGGVKTP